MPGGSGLRDLGFDEAITGRRPRRTGVQDPQWFWSQGKGFKDGEFGWRLGFCNLVWIPLQLGYLSNLSSWE